MRANATRGPEAPELRHRIMAGFVGNVVEWYDFALYGYLAGVIAPVFFPERDRLSGYSVAFDIGLGVFGGLTPMLASWLLAVTGVPSTPGIYLSVAAFLAVGALALIPDRSRGPLR